MKKLLPVLFLGIAFSTGINAKEYFIKGPQFFRHDFSTSVPQTFLVNRNGEIVFHHEGKTRKIRQAINSPKKLESSDHLMSQLSKVLDETIKYDESDYTLVEIIWDKDSHDKNCNPCDSQVKINSAFIKAMSKKGITINRDTVYQIYVASFVKDW